MLDFDIVYSDMSEFDNFHPSPSTRLRSLFTLMPPITDVTHRSISLPFTLDHLPSTLLNPPFTLMPPITDVTHRAISSLFTLITYNRRATPLYGIVRAI